MTEPEDLEDFFAAARRQAPRPDAALAGRIAADADCLAGTAGWRGVWRLLGGWPAVAGFAAAALAGLWIGSAGPVGTMAGTDGYDIADLMPGYGSGWEEPG